MIFINFFSNSLFMTNSKPILDYKYIGKLYDELVYDWIQEIFWKTLIINNILKLFYDS